MPAASHDHARRKRRRVRAATAPSPASIMASEEASRTLATWPKPMWSMPRSPSIAGPKIQYSSRFAVLNAYCLTINPPSPTPHITLGVKAVNPVMLTLLGDIAASVVQVPVIPPPVDL